MSLNLSQAWVGSINHSVPDATAQRHVQSLIAAPGDVQALIHCELLGGLLKGDSYIDCKPDMAIYAILKELEKSGREIIVVHSTISPIAKKILDRHFPDANWEIKNRITSGLEWSDRSMGQLPQAEMIVTPFTHDDMPLDSDAHVTVLKASELTL